MTSVTIVRTIEAPPEAVFAAFVQPDKIALWWGPDDGPVLSAEIEARVGGRFHIRFRLAEDGSEHGSSGTLEVFDPPRRLVMSWAWDDSRSRVASRRHLSGRSRRHRGHARAFTPRRREGARSREGLERRVRQT